MTERLLEANEGREVDVVFDMTGGETFERSYRALAHFGRIVVCGISSREPNRISSGSLLRHSRSLVGFYLFHCLERPGMFDEALSDLFVRVVARRGDGARGRHLPLETRPPRRMSRWRERRTTGKVLLDPTT